MTTALYIFILYYIFINIWFAIRRLNKYILYAKGLSKGTQASQMKWKCTNEKMAWNTQDTNLSSYVPNANVDHTKSCQGTGISTLDHSATTPRAVYHTNEDLCMICHMISCKYIHILRLQTYTWSKNSQNSVSHISQLLARLATINHTQSPDLISMDITNMTSIYAWLTQINKQISQKRW